MRHRAVVIGAVVMSGALALTACSNSSKSSSSGGNGGSKSGSTSASDILASIQPDAKLTGMLPANVKSAGKVTVATDPSYAPNEFFANDNKTIIGFDVDLGKAIGKKLGVPFDFTKASFDAIIPGLQAGTYQLGMSSFTDTKDREKTVDFVTYYSAGSSLYVKSGNPEHLSPSDQSLCGKKVAVEKGTTQLDELSTTIDVSKGLGTRTKACKDAGKPGPVAQPYPDQNGANLALSSGRADGVLADSPVAAYAVKQSSGQFQLAGAVYNTAPYGIAISKNLGTTKDAVLAALKELIADGTYNKIMGVWGLQSGGISTPMINGAQS
jgi:polar amino acid transport system substrate-binding protein